MSRAKPQFADRSHRPVSPARPFMQRLAIAALFLLAVNGSAGAATTAFVNVNVLPMTSGEAVPSQTVIVEGGVIRTIGDFGDTPVPDEATVVDGTDRYLVPGLAEMHGHVPGGSSPDLERVLALYVANGVTTVRGMLGQPSHLQLRAQLAAGEVLGPRLITSGPSFNGGSVSNPAAAVAMVREQHAAGYDFLKIHPGLSMAEFDAIAATARELGIPFAGHVPEDVGVKHALQAGIATIDHLDGYLQALLPPDRDSSGGLPGFFGVFTADDAEEDRIAALAAATAAAGTWNVPTQTLFAHVVSPVPGGEEMAAWPEMKYVTAETVAGWLRYRSDVTTDVNYRPASALRAIALRQQLIRALFAADAGLLLGSDSPQVFNVPGFSLHRELAHLVEAGLEPLAAWQSGTVHAARYFGREQQFGSVAEGLAADLVLLDADPLAEIGNSRRIHGVMVRGRWLSRSELDALLARFAR